jgi:hypothetical protein
MIRKRSAGSAITMQSPKRLAMTASTLAAEEETEDKEEVERQNRYYDEQSAKADAALLASSSGSCNNTPAAAAGAAPVRSKRPRSRSNNNTFTQALKDVSNSPARQPSTRHLVFPASIEFECPGCSSTLSAPNTAQQCLRCAECRKVVWPTSSGGPTLIVPIIVEDSVQPYKSRFNCVYAAPDIGTTRWSARLSVPAHAPNDFKYTRSKNIEYLGTFDTEEAASAARRVRCEELGIVFKEFSSRKVKFSVPQQAAAAFRQQQFRLRGRDCYDETLARINGGYCNCPGVLDSGEVCECTKHLKLGSTMGRRRKAVKRCGNPADVPPPMT